jgi:hypothetical protein
MGFFAARGLALYLAAWAIVFPVQTIVVFADGHGELTYWVFNALILAGGIGLNRVGARLRRQRRRVVENGGVAT